MSKREPFWRVLAAIKKREASIDRYERPIIKDLIKHCPLKSETKEGVIELVNSMLVLKREYARHKILDYRIAITKEPKPFTLAGLIRVHPIFKKPGLDRIGAMITKHGVRHIRMLQKGGET